MKLSERVPQEQDAQVQQDVADYRRVQALAEDHVTSFGPPMPPDRNAASAGEIGIRVLLGGGRYSSTTRKRLDAFNQA